MSPSEPFLAKPPLATWLAAASWKLLGSTEFALRAPSLLMAIITIAIVAAIAGDLGIGRAGRRVTVAVLATTPLFMVVAGAVMTDAVHLALVSAGMWLAWRAIHAPDQRRWRLVFWGVIGAATLAKGLATLALIGLPLLAYAACGGGASRVWRGLWDGVGVLLAATIALAWYLPAERAYPGFLNYFLVGEHLQRFLQPGWSGDRYGRPHRVPWGTIWLYWAVAIAPWMGLFIAQVAAVWTRMRRRELAPADRWLWCWLLAPLIFFTLASNIIWTYALTAVPPFALLCGGWSEHATGRLRRVVPTAIALIATVSVILGVWWLPRMIDASSSRELIRAAQTQRPGVPIVVRGLYPFSASYYTRGTVRRGEDPRVFAAALTQPRALLIVPLADAPEWLAQTPVRELARNARGMLVEVQPPTPQDRREEHRQ
jgi:4-amino-4-deoxy-L-arabinose transferase-like glycosyltransferase